ncbi:MAG: hypothetical protein ABSB91_04105 [Sedimentisphaerales bacterium]|jgi:hypothetical protein
MKALTGKVSEETSLTLILISVLALSLIIRSITSGPIKHRESYIESESYPEKEFAEADLRVFEEMKRLHLAPIETISEIETLERDANDEDKEAQRLYDSIPEGTVSNLSPLVNDKWAPVFIRVKELRNWAYETREKAQNKKRFIAQNYGDKLKRTSSATIWEQREKARIALENFRLLRPRLGVWGTIVSIIHIIATLVVGLVVLLLLLYFGGAM